MTRIKGFNEQTDYPYSVARNPPRARTNTPVDRPDRMPVPGIRLAEKGSIVRRVQGFGRWMRHLRKSRTESNMGQVATALGLSRGVMHNMENLDVVPKRKTLEKLILMYGLGEDEQDMLLFRAGYWPDEVRSVLMQRPEGLGRVVLKIAREPAYYTMAVAFTLPMEKQMAAASEGFHALRGWQEIQARPAEDKNFSRFQKSFHNLEVSLKKGDVENSLEFWRQTEHWKKQCEREDKKKVG
jgi:hypothetical protein